MRRNKKQNLREEVLAEINQRRISASQASAAMDLAASTVRRYLQGELPETERVADEMRLFLARLRRGELFGPAGEPKLVSIDAAAGARPPRRRRRRHYDTETFRQVFSTIDYCVENAALGVILAEFGSGKTHAAKMWRSRHAVESLYFEFDEFTSSAKVAFLSTLASQLGLADHCSQHSSSAVFRKLVERLRAEPTVLIFDQCEMVSVRVFQIVRQLWDRSWEEGGAVVLLSSPQLLHRLDRGRAGDLGALRSRVGVWASLRGVTREEMSGILKHEGLIDVDAAAFDLWFHAIRGSMRYLLESVDLIRSRHKGKRVTERTVIEVSRRLMGIPMMASGSRPKRDEAASAAG